jgi:predicted DNA-binding transcriptional regulator AlpA
MVPRVDTENLVGAAEAAELLGLAQPNSVSIYARRYPDFPKPVVELPRSKVRLWRRSEVIAWGRRRQGARARKSVQ